MPKVTLEFNLPEEEDEFRLAHAGGSYRAVLYDLDNYLRNQSKYSSLSKERSECYSDVRQVLLRLAADSDVDI